MQEPLLAGVRHLRHLVQRFIGHVSASGLTPRQQLQVNEYLHGEAAALFWAQQGPDQVHAYEVAARVAALLPDDEDAYLAALLHDVGKRHAHLGAVRRSIATILDAAGLPLSAPMLRYRLHGPIGAAELSASGFDGIVVSFAAHHPDPAPHGVDPHRWQALLEADG